MSAILKRGDVVVQKKAGTAVAVWGPVMTDGVKPDCDQLGTVSEVESAAKIFVSKTGGTIHVEELPPPSRAD